jgi:hypothetical protein
MKFTHSPKYFKELKSNFNNLYFLRQRALWRKIGRKKQLHFEVAFLFSLGKIHSVLSSKFGDKLSCPGAFHMRGYHSCMSLTYRILAKKKKSNYIFFPNN